MESKDRVVRVDGILHPEFVTVIDGEVVPDPCESAADDLAIIALVVCSGDFRRFSAGWILESAEHLKWEVTDLGTGSSIETCLVVGARPVGHTRPLEEGMRLIAAEPGS